MLSSSPFRVVVVGGGFGGLNLVRALSDSRFHVTLVDRRNFHLFQPLLYQVATGGLSPADIASPLREILKHQRNAHVALAEVTGFDLAHRRVLLSQVALEYDALAVATGARHHYFGKEEWEPLAPGLKTLEDATTMRRKVLLAFEYAEREQDAGRRRAWLTFVIVGGGPTGVELAGAVAELAKDMLRRDFRSIPHEEVKILLVEGQDRVLSQFVPALSSYAERTLSRLGVGVRPRSKVVEIREDEAVIDREGALERVATRTVLWAAGVKASPLGAALAQATGAQVDRAGRVVVDADFSLPGHPEVFVVGDLASYSHETGSPLPGVAPVAIQAGRHVASVLRNRLDGEPPPRFRYHDRGDLATIGRAAAVGKIGRLRLTGFIAWVLWLFVHLMSLAGFENRVLVLIQWAWGYFTRNRSARLITGEKR